MQTRAKKHLSVYMQKLTFWKKQLKRNNLFRAHFFSLLAEWQMHEVLGTV